MRKVLPLAAPPKSICLLRLSALGDCVNVLPIVHTLQHHWPQTKLTWIIGAAAAPLVGDLPGVEFIVLDKRAGAVGRRALQRQLAGRRFDVLLHLHAGFRANLVARRVPATIRLGFDRERARDFQRLFVGQRIAPQAGRHVVDGFFGFLQALGLHEQVLDWSLPIGMQEHEQAAKLLPGEQPTLLISPCASHPFRQWWAARYAAVADYAVESLGMRVALMGGAGASDRALGDAIRAAMRNAPVDLIGRSSLKLLIAVLERGQILLTPDSGPAHMANITRTPTIALHATADSRRSGPYLNLQWCVDRYDAAARKFLHKPASALRWGTKIHRAGAMDLISIEDVTSRLAELAGHLRIGQGLANGRGL